MIMFKENTLYAMFVEKANSLAVQLSENTLKGTTVVKNILAKHVQANLLLVDCCWIIQDMFMGRKLNVTVAVTNIFPNKPT